MDFINEYGLLFVVAAPVAIIVILNVVLALTGESGTLLLPSLKPFPRVEMPEVEARCEPAPVIEVEAAATDYEEIRKAA